MEEIRKIMHQSLSLVFLIRQSRASKNEECTVYARLTAKDKLNFE